MIPQTFNDWTNCIINDCKINLNKEFAGQRLEVYKNPNNPETQKFISLYGEAHLRNIINWFDIISKA
jgi:hypothetical protein